MALMQRTLTAEKLREQVLDGSAKLRDAFIRYDAQVRRASHGASRQRARAHPFTPATPSTRAWSPVC